MVDLSIGRHNIIKQSHIKSDGAGFLIIRKRLSIVSMFTHIARTIDGKQKLLKNKRKKKFKYPRSSTFE